MKVSLMNYFTFTFLQNSDIFLNKCFHQPLDFLKRIVFPLHLHVFKLVKCASWIYTRQLHRVRLFYSLQGFSMLSVSCICSFRLRQWSRGPVNRALVYQPRGLRFKITRCSKADSAFHHFQVVPMGTRDSQRLSC